MGRRAAIALHLALFLLGTLLYIVFVLPRWWVLTGDIPSTLATAGRIAAGLPIGAAAVPVWLILQRSLRPSAATPELALRLRAWSAVLHVVAGGLILLTAIVEIWLSLTVAGPWLFGVYGAAAATAILAVAAFYLSFIAEKPPGPVKPAKAKKAPKPKEKKSKQQDQKESDADVVDTDAPEPSSETGPADETEPVDTSTETDSAEPSGGLPDESGESVAEAVAEADEPAAGGLRNQRRRRLRR